MSTVGRLGIETFGIVMFRFGIFGADIEGIGTFGTGTETLDSELRSCFCNNFLNFLAHVLNIASFLSLSSCSCDCWTHNC